MHKGYIFPIDIVNSLEKINKELKSQALLATHVSKLKDTYEKIHNGYIDLTIDNSAKIPYYVQISTISSELPQVKVLKKNTSSISKPSLKSRVVKSKQLKQFNSSLVDILEAIKKADSIEEVNIVEAIRNPNFRFTTPDHPELSLLVSDVLSIAIKFGNEIKPEIQQLGTKAIKKNANEFAKEMFPVIQNLKRDHCIDTFRETVDLLNMKKIKTARGGKWHLGTYQKLVERWKSLGYNL